MSGGGVQRPPAAEHPGKLPVPLHEGASFGRVVAQSSINSPSVDQALHSLDEKMDTMLAKTQLLLGEMSTPAMEQRRILEENELREREDVEYSMVSLSGRPPPLDVPKGVGVGEHEHFQSGTTSTAGGGGGSLLMPSFPSADSAVLRQRVNLLAAAPRPVGGGDHRDEDSAVMNADVSMQQRLRKLEDKVEALQLQFRSGGGEVAVSSSSCSPPQQVPSVTDLCSPASASRSQGSTSVSLQQQAAPSKQLLTGTETSPSCSRRRVAANAEVETRAREAHHQQHSPARPGRGPTPGRGPINVGGVPGAAGGAGSTSKLLSKELQKRFSPVKQGGAIARPAVLGGHHHQTRSPVRQIRATTPAINRTVRAGATPSSSTKRSKQFSQFVAAHDDSMPTAAAAEGDDRSFQIFEDDAITASASTKANREDAASAAFRWMKQKPPGAGASAATGTSRQMGARVALQPQLPNYPTLLASFDRQQDNNIIGPRQGGPPSLDVSGSPCDDHVGSVSESPCVSAAEDDNSQSVGQLHQQLQNNKSSPSPMFGSGGGNKKVVVSACFPTVAPATTSRGGARERYTPRGQLEKSMKSNPAVAVQPPQMNVFQQAAALAQSSGLLNEKTSQEPRSDSQRARQKLEAARGGGGLMEQTKLQTIMITEHEQQKSSPQRQPREPADLVPPKKTARQQYVQAGSPKLAAAFSALSMEEDVDLTAAAGGFDGVDELGREPVVLEGRGDGLHPVPQNKNKNVVVEKLPDEDVGNQLYLRNLNLVQTATTGDGSPLMRSRETSPHAYCHATPVSRTKSPRISCEGQQQAANLRRNNMQLVVQLEEAARTTCPNTPAATRYVVKVNKAVPLSSKKPIRTQAARYARSPRFRSPSTATEAISDDVRGAASGSSAGAAKKDVGRRFIPLARATGGGARENDDIGRQDNEQVISSRSSGGGRTKAEAVLSDELTTKARRPSDALSSMTSRASFRGEQGRTSTTAKSAVPLLVPTSTTTVSVTTAAAVPDPEAARRCVHQPYEKYVHHQPEVVAQPPATPTAENRDKLSATTVPGSTCASQIRRTLQSGEQKSRYTAVAQAQVCPMPSSIVSSSAAGTNTNASGHRRGAPVIPVLPPTSMQLLLPVTFKRTPLVTKPLFPVVHHNMQHK